jgi:hypothetical protein
MQTEMNTEMRELTSAELDAVNGGLRPGDGGCTRPGPKTEPLPLYIDPKVFEPLSK